MIRIDDQDFINAVKERPTDVAWELGYTAETMYALRRRWARNVRGLYHASADMMAKRAAWLKYGDWTRWQEFKVKPEPVIRPLKPVFVVLTPIGIFADVFRYRESAKKYARKMGVGYQVKTVELKR